MVVTAVEDKAALVEAKATLEVASEVNTLRTAIMPGLNLNIKFSCSRPFKKYLMLKTD